MTKEEILSELKQIVDDANGYDIDPYIIHKLLEKNSENHVDFVLDEEDIEEIEYLINGNGGDERDAVEEFLQGRFRDYFEMSEFDEPESYELIFDYKGNRYHMEIEENGCCESAWDHRIMYWTKTVTKL